MLDNSMTFQFRTAFGCSAIPDIKNSTVNRSEAAKCRLACRKNELQVTPEGHAPKHVQVNLFSLPKADAFDFLLFCLRNPSPCPILEVLEPGDPISKSIAPGADIRTDLPGYRIMEKGEVKMIVPDATDYWRNDLVSFMMGCSVSWDTELSKVGLTPRHLQENLAIPCYQTNIPLQSAGKFRGKRDSLLGETQEGCP